MASRIVIDPKIRFQHNRSTAAVGRCGAQNDAAQKDLDREPVKRHLLSQPMPCWSLNSALPYNARLETHPFGRLFQDFCAPLKCGSLAVVEVGHESLRDAARAKHARKGEGDVAHAFALSRQHRAR